MLGQRVLIKLEDKEPCPSFEELGLFETIDVVYPRFIQATRRKDTLEVLFADHNDMTAFLENLTQIKMGRD